MSSVMASPLVADRGREFLSQFITRLLGEHSIGEKVVSGSHEPASDRIKWIELIEGRLSAWVTREIPRVIAARTEWVFYSPVYILCVFDNRRNFDELRDNSKQEADFSVSWFQVDFNVN